MRSRSSVTRRRASDSRVCSARSARSVTATMYSRRERVASPAAPAKAMITANWITRASRAPTVAARRLRSRIEAAVAIITITLSRRGRRFATANMATAAAITMPGESVPVRAAAP